MAQETPSLRRQIGLSTAVWLGLGSILGAGVYVAVPHTVQSSGAMALVALLVAGGIAVCNGLSSAQLAAAHPQSGGTYEYGYRFLSPWVGRAAGWLFLCAKSASAAVSARAAAATILMAVDTGDRQLSRWERPVALLLIFLLTTVVVLGLKRSAALNRVLVAITLVGLATFCIGAFLRPAAAWPEETFHGLSWREFGYATAFLFVAFTGYGRVATLGEEIQDPRRNVPIAVVVTLAVALTVYWLVGYCVVRRGPVLLSGTTVLTKILAADAGPFERWLVAVGALAATLGVLLNLLLGLSRTAFAMARRADLPPILSVLTDAEPRRAVMLVGVVIGGFAALETAPQIWSVSAGSVLFYYAATNACALCLDSQQRFLPRILMWVGLVGCLAAASTVPAQAWAIIGVVVGLGFAFSWAVQRLVHRD